MFGTSAYFTIYMHLLNLLYYMLHHNLLFACLSNVSAIKILLNVLLCHECFLWPVVAS